MALVEAVDNEVILLVIGVVVAASCVVYELILGQLSPRSSLPPDANPPAAAPSAYPATNCPICLEELSYRCLTNCGHLFCTACLHAYWQRPGGGGGLHRLQCPCCRRQINLLHVDFTEDRSTNEATLHHRHIQVTLLSLPVLQLENQ